MLSDGELERMYACVLRRLERYCCDHPDDLCCKRALSEVQLRTNVGMRIALAMFGKATETVQPKGPLN